MLIALLRALFMETAISTPQTEGGLPAVGPDMAEFWQLQHCVRPAWALYASTLMTTWPRPDSLNISSDFLLQVRVTINNGC